MAETAKDAWDTLKWEFEVTGATSRVFLLRELYTMCMSEEDNLDTHTQCIHSIYQDLKIAGKGLSEGNFIMALLMSLLPSWDNFISSTDISRIDSMDDQKKRELMLSRHTSKLNGRGGNQETIHLRPQAHSIHLDLQNRIIINRTNHVPTN